MTRHAPPPAGDEDTVPVVEERLRDGKREVNRGGVRVRSIVEEAGFRKKSRFAEERAWRSSVAP